MNSFPLAGPTREVSDRYPHQQADLHTLSKYHTHHINIHVLIFLCLMIWLVMLTHLKKVIQLLITCV